MAAAFAKLWSDLRAVRVCVAAAARTLLGGSSRVRRARALPRPFSLTTRLLVLQAEPAFLDAVDLLAQSQPRLVQARRRSKPCPLPPSPCRHYCRCCCLPAAYRGGRDG